MAEDYLSLTKGPDGAYGLPRLPSIQDILGAGTPDANQNNIFRLLQAPQGRMTDALPGLRELLLGSQGPAIQALRQGTQSNVAAAQSDAMRRGLTGSDIEAANMSGARQAGTMQEGQLLAQQSSVLAQYIMQALGMDIQGNWEMFVTLAQALGQELGSQRDMEQARLMREAAANEAAKNRKASLWGSLIGAGGAIGGGALGGWLAAPAAAGAGAAGAGAAAGAAGTGAAGATAAAPAAGFGLLPALGYAGAGYGLYEIGKGIASTFKKKKRPETPNYTPTYAYSGGGGMSLL